MTQKAAWLLSITILIMIVACEKKEIIEPKAQVKEVDPAAVVAVVGDAQITFKEIQNEMRYRGGHIPGRFSTIESKKVLLDEMIHFEVLAQKAKEAGYDKDPEIQAAVKKMMVKKYKQDYLNLLLDKQRITNLEVQKYYQENKEQFSTPEMARPAVISIRFGLKENQKTKAAKRELAQKVRIQAVKQSSKSKDFGQLAKKYSDDPRSKYRGGAMNWMAKNTKIFQLEKKVVEAVFKLKKPGDISPVIETEKGLYLVKLINKRPPKVKEYKIVRDQIKRSMVAKKQQLWLEEFYKEAKEDVKITINQTKLEAIPTPGRFANSKNKPPAFPVN